MRHVQQPSSHSNALVLHTHIKDDSNRTVVEALEITAHKVDHYATMHNLIWTHVVIHLQLYKGKFTLPQQQQINNNTGSLNTWCMLLVTPQVVSADRTSHNPGWGHHILYLGHVSHGEPGCWEGHSNWIVDKSSLRSVLALYVMEVNNHLNGSCLSSDGQTGGEKKSKHGWPAAECKQSLLQCLSGRLEECNMLI